MPTMTTITYIRQSVGELVVDFFSSQVLKIPPNRTVPYSKKHHHVSLQPTDKALQKWQNKILNRPKTQN